MKDLNRMICAATVALGLASAGQVMAQSQLSGPEGAAMSPKLRFLLAQPQYRGIVMPAQPSPVWPSGVNPAEAAASPKQQQMLTQSQTGRGTQETGVASANRPMGAHGLAASPKLQQLMEQNSVQFEIAPLK